jgi:hypothetical protein
VSVEDVRAGLSAGRRLWVKWCDGKDVWHNATVRSNDSGKGAGWAVGSHGPWSHSVRHFNVSITHSCFSIRNILSGV